MQNKLLLDPLEASAEGEYRPVSNLSLRARYLLEKRQIQSEIGTLPQILDALGLSQRRVCQLLLVDPSAWTRWNKTDAPPHIYQALRWLIQLKKINPEIVGPADLSSRLDFVQASTHSKIKELERGLAMMERSLVLAPLTSKDDSTRQALLEQEQRFQEKIALLAAKIQEISKAKSKIHPLPKSLSKKKRRKKHQPKKQKKAPKKQIKKPSKKLKKKTPAKPLRSHRARQNKKKTR